MFYYHIHQSTKPNKDRFLKEHNHICHQHKGRYGYRRICVELNQTLASQGMVINHKRVQRLAGNGFKSQNQTTKTQTLRILSRGTQDKIKDNALQRNFKTTRPNQKWATDVTGFKVEVVSNGGDGSNGSHSKTYQKLYLSPIIDLFNGEIVSYAIKEHPAHDLVNEMLNNALSKLNPDEKPIVHSDRGTHYQ
ncbi:MAG: IS3 family transposase [Moraxella sp.]|nr:IS3 family transposase [Moraxella sp.]